jgi:dihydrodiol dehydrogenase / D-xylose 1-dehydrogenase (NADP)
MRRKSMKKIKWGIIGLGNIANKFAKTVKAMDSVETFSSSIKR